MLHFMLFHNIVRLLSGVVDQEWTRFLSSFPPTSDLVADFNFHEKIYNLHDEKVIHRFVIWTSGGLNDISDFLNTL